MADQSKLMREWRVDPDSKLIRFYKWAYTEDVSTLTFCKLFWGVVAAPIVVCVIGVLALVPDKKEKPEADKAAAKPKATKPKRSRRWTVAVASFFAKVGDVIASGFQHVNQMFNPLRRFSARHPWVWKSTIVVVLSACVIALLGGATIGLIAWCSLAWPSFKIALIVLGTMVGLVAAVLGVILFVDHFTGAVETFGDWCLRILTPIGHGFRYFGRFMAFGYHAVKNRTCPRVIVNEPAS